MARPRWPRPGLRLSGAVLVDVEMSAPPTLLGSILGDETASLGLAEAWGVYPPDLRGPFANDLYGRLADNFEGAEDPLEAAMAFLCVLTRDAGVAFDATDFWAAAKRFVREERKRAADGLPRLAAGPPHPSGDRGARVRGPGAETERGRHPQDRQRRAARLGQRPAVGGCRCGGGHSSQRIPLGPLSRSGRVLVAATWALSTLQKVARSRRRALR